MNNMTEFEKEYYRKEGLYEIMDPNKFYDDIVDNVEYVQKPSE
jgi:hypothetical protein